MEKKNHTGMCLLFILLEAKDSGVASTELWEQRKATQKPYTQSRWICTTKMKGTTLRIHRNSDCVLLKYHFEENNLWKDFNHATNKSE